MPRFRPYWTIRNKLSSSLVGLLLIISGTFLIFTALAWRTYKSGILSFQLNENVSSSLNTNFTHDSAKAPARLIITKVNIDLPIVPTKIKGQVWEIPDNAAGHLSASAYPGELGRIIIYGHNKTSLLGPIRWLTTNDSITVQSADQSAQNYQITSITEVEPNQLEVLAPTIEETLTLYTCSGFFDSKRFVIQAKRRT